jgi:hypothetical protein
MRALIAWKHHGLEPPGFARFEHPPRAAVVVDAHQVLLSHRADAVLDDFLYQRLERLASAPQGPEMQPRPPSEVLALLMLFARQQEPAAAIPEDVRTEAGLELDHGHRGFLAEIAETAPLDPQLEAPAAGAVRLLTEPGREPVNRIVLVDGDRDGEEIGKQGAGAPRDLPKHRHPRAGGHEDQGS